MSTLLTFDTEALSPAVGALSARERAVLDELAGGWSNGAIAGRLYLSERTVEAHLHSIMLKLGLPPRAETNRRVLAATMWLAATG